MVACRRRHGFTIIGCYCRISSEFDSERLDQFFVANNIGNYPADASAAVIAAAGKKVAVTISAIHKNSYNLLRDLSAVQQIQKEKTFEQ